MIQSVREQHIDEGKDGEVRKTVSEIISEGAFQRLAIPKKQRRRRSPALPRAHRGFLSGLSSSLSGKHDSVLCGSHRCHDVTVTAGGKPMLIIHQGNNYHKSRNKILGRQSHKYTERKVLNGGNSFTLCLDHFIVCSAEITFCLQHQITRQVFTQSQEATQHTLIDCQLLKDLNALSSLSQEGVSSDESCHGTSAQFNSSTVKTLV